MSGLLDQLTAKLLAELSPQGHWVGELSSSALSTAVATIALGQVDKHAHASYTNQGLEWLARNANADGGWGDTVRSKSNISTTALCWAAFGAAGADDRFRTVVSHCESWLSARSGDLSALPRAIADRYGKDRTFSVPILMTLALSGRLGPNGWRQVPALPFELAMLPRGFYGALRLPVVSYALPALIAIGQVIHHHSPSRNPLARFCRATSRARTLELLASLQPENGGFLEATPLTAFVTMSLASAGQGNNIVAERGASFLRASMRPDGSWPIDTNLATWVTTLSIKALSHEPDRLDESKRARLREWLLRQQTSGIHPYTGAASGAWAWTDLPGGVPDADDTAGALLALALLGDTDAAAVAAAGRGIEWLLNLQNRDGGIPTFCAGWGTLPFDRSTPEITAHALRAWHAWRGRLETGLQARVDRAAGRARAYLRRAQRKDGAFVPLWFGNEHAAKEENAVYGTAQVLISLNEIDGPRAIREPAAAFLESAQQASGGWGGDRHAPETIEETAVALEALIPLPEHRRAVESGAARLEVLIKENFGMIGAPIGLYFARLWYYEKLYPLIFATSALGKLRAASNRPLFPSAAGAF